MDDFDGKLRQGWLYAGVWGGQNILPYIILGRSGKFDNMSEKSQGILREKKLGQSVGTLFLFSLVYQLCLALW